LEVIRNPSGYHLYFDYEFIDYKRLKDRARRRLQLEPGTYRVRVDGVYYQPLEKTVKYPIENPNLREPSSPDPDRRDPLRPYTFSLSPSFAYPFPDPYPVQITPDIPCSGAVSPGQAGPTLLRGSLHNGDGSGMSGAKIVAPGISNTYTTNESGLWVLWFPDSHPTGLVTVQVTQPDGAVVPVPNVCVVRGREASLHETALRGWVRQAGVGVAGARVTVSGQAEAILSGLDGEWTYYFPLNQTGVPVVVTATLPDGRSASRNAMVVPRATALVEPINLP
jgi:hypothetical protein